MECKELIPVAKHDGIENELGEQTDENENLQIDPIKNDSNANTADVRYADCDIRKKKTDLENNKSALDEVTLDDAKKSVVISEVLSAMAKAASQDNWIEYDSEKDDLNTWLENNKPSQILRSSGVGWISVSVSSSVNDHDRINELQKSWELLTSQDDEITITDIQVLASEFSLTAGKWLLHVNSDQVDMTWRIVATALDSGELGPNVYQVKVSSVTGVDEVNNKHVICVYNKDFTNEEELLEAEASLRQAGLRCVLQYKPYIFSVLGVDRNNSWGLRPTVYQSQFEMNEETPVIESILEKTWFWNNAKGFGKQEINEGKAVMDDDKDGNIGQVLKKPELEEDDKTVSRACNYFNDVGICNLKSGHLSKSGFTQKIHICRHCFAINCQEQAHAEPHCPGKSHGVNEIKHLNNQAIEKGNTDVIARPCDYFNELGSCKYSSGHLSQSGFTRRVHICRLCFSRHGDEETHPESQCDRQSKDNTESLLSVINSLNQLKLAELRNRSGDCEKVEGIIFGGGKGSRVDYGRSRPLVDSGKRNNGCQGDNGRRNNEYRGDNGRNSGTKGENGRRNVGPRADSGRRNGITEGNNGRGNGVTRESLFLKKWNESTPQSRLDPTVSSEKERESLDGGTMVNGSDQERCGFSAGKFKGQRYENTCEERWEGNNGKSGEKTSKDKCGDRPDGNSQLIGKSAIKSGESEPPGKSLRNRKVRRNEHHDTKNQRKRSLSRKDFNNTKKIDADVKPNPSLGLSSSKTQTLVSDKNDRLSNASNKCHKLENTKALKKRNKNGATSSKEKSTENVKDSKKMDNTFDHKKTEKLDHGYAKYSKEPSMGNAINSLANIFKSIQSSNKSDTEANKNSILGYEDNEADKYISQKNPECSPKLPKDNWKTNGRESNAAEDKVNITRKQSTESGKYSHKNQQDSGEKKRDAGNIYDHKDEEKSENKEKLYEKRKAIEKLSSQENIVETRDKTSQTEYRQLTRGKLAHNGASNEKSTVTQSVSRNQFVSGQPFMTSGQISSRKSLATGQPTSGKPMATGQQKVEKILASEPLLINSLLQQLQENHPNPAMNPLQPKIKPIPAQQNVEKKVFLSKPELRMFSNPPTPAFVHKLPVSKGKEKGRKTSHCPCPPYCPPCLDKIRNRV